MMNCLCKHRSSHTLASMLGSTATTSDRHFMALVLTAMALSPRTRKIYKKKKKNTHQPLITQTALFSVPLFTKQRQTSEAWYHLYYSVWTIYILLYIAFVTHWKDKKNIQILPVLNKYQSSGRTASWRPNNARSDRSHHNPQCQSSFWREVQRGKIL